MKRLLIILFSLPLLVVAQNKPLVIEGVSPNFYLNHTVAPKENYYSIGRIYNISPREIAPFNNLVLENGLSLGQSIKIPLSASNFLQTPTAAQDEALIPIYHTIAGKESIYKVSQNYNKLSLESLRKWNKLKGDAVNNGANLIVGFLKVKKALSPLANTAAAKPGELATAENAPVVDKVPAKPAVAKEPEAPAAVSPVIEIPRQAEKPKPEPTVAPVKKEVEQVSHVQVSVKGNKGSNGGVFKVDYDKQVANQPLTTENGTAAVFKSTSGWEDGKYYCLHNNSTPGTILKVTNALNGKIIYVKVLDMMPDIKQNTGLLLSLSNAAAEELGVGEGKFTCSISYSK